MWRSFYCHILCFCVQNYKILSNFANIGKNLKEFSLFYDAFQCLRMRDMFMWNVSFANTHATPLKYKKRHTSPNRFVWRIIFIGSKTQND